MTHHALNSDAAALNRAWKAAQEKAAQKPDKEPAIAPAAKESTAGVLPDAQNKTPPECRGCEVYPECVRIMKMWHQHAPRPDLARAWCAHFDKNSVRMCCLSGLRSDEPVATRFSLREGK